MPETKTNGYSNGNHSHNGYEMEDNASFLFTSESVGEGHPGKNRPRIHFETFRRAKKISSSRGGKKKKTIRREIVQEIVVISSLLIMRVRHLQPSPLSAAFTSLFILRIHSESANFWRFFLRRTSKNMCFFRGEIKFHHPVERCQ